MYGIMGERTFKQEVRRSSLSWLLVLGFWCFHLGLLVAGALGCSGSLALAPGTDGSSCGACRCPAHRGLRSRMVRGLLLEAGPDTGTRASPGSSLWDTDAVQHGTRVLGRLKETGSSAPDPEAES